VEEWEWRRTKQTDLPEFLLATAASDMQLSYHRAGLSFHLHLGYPQFPYGA